MVIRVDQPQHAIPTSLWGIFFEEINHAGEGGLFAELLRNRSFDEPLPPEGRAIPGWTRGDAAILEPVPGPDASRAHAVRLHGSMHSTGHFGLPIRASERFIVRVDAKRVGDARLTVAIEDSEGKRLAAAPIEALSDRWDSTMVSLLTTDAAHDARFVVTTEGQGDVHIDLLSLIPASTWRGHGLRNDLAELVAAMKPAFVRFPGGCYVEGGDLLKDAFRWPQTVGDAARRPGHMNATWGYWTSDGLGFHELLQWCEDLGAEPLYVLNCGMSHKELVPTEELGPWIQEALDAIEYANGPQDTPFGMRRADNGHPAPFGLKYIEIGNENGMFGEGPGAFGGSRAQYAERYRLFRDAIHARYPDIRIIANTRIDAPADLIDDHFYNTPGWFWQNVSMYDRIARNGERTGGTPSPAIYVGEFAVTQGCGLGNLDAALAEAAFMTGLERNSDLVRMASYAPLFVHAQDRRWNPDAIVFDAQRSYGTPSYWVQALFAEHRPETLVPIEMPSLPLTQPVGTVGIGTWRTQAEFKDLSLSIEGQPAIRVGDAPFLQTNGTWTRPGTPSSGDPTAFTMREEADERLALFDLPGLRDATDYTFSLKARKLAGAEGFLIAFHATATNALTWWNIGGWGNTSHAIERTDGGRLRLGAGTAGTIETNRWYDIRVECSKGRVRCFLDGTLIHDLDERIAPRVAAVAGRNAQTGEVIVKLVNGTNEALAMSVELSGIERIGRGEIIALGGSALGDENGFAAPTSIAPKRTILGPSSGPLAVEFAPRSCTVLRLVPSTR